MRNDVPPDDYWIGPPCFPYIFRPVCVGHPVGRARCAGLLLWAKDVNTPCFDGDVR